MQITEGLTFDDILLVPQFSDVTSRSQVDISTTLGTLNLDIPILSANMDTITEGSMANAMASLGGLGVLHRYADIDNVLTWLESLVPEKRFPSVGIKEDDLKKAEEYLSLTRNICVDVAHGDSQQVVDMVRKLVKIGFQNIMAGNVATYWGAFNLLNAGANIIKVGVGPGSVCTTRIVTGHGVPQLTAIQEAVRATEQIGGSVVADGGIRNSGDIVKALAFGADAVMLGGMLAGTDESPAAKMGVYRGMASAEAQMSFRGNVSNNTPEGVCHPIEHKGKVGGLIEQLVGGIRSGFSYSGAVNLPDLQENAVAVRITGNGLIESHPHGLRR